MQVRHVFTIVSEFAVRDSQNKFSFINIVHNLKLPELPGSCPMLFIGTAFEGGEGQPFTIALEDPSGKELFRTAEKEVGPLREDEAAKNLKKVSYGVIQLMPAVFYAEGIHTIVIRVGNKVIHRQSLPILKKPATGGDDDGRDETADAASKTEELPSKVARPKPRSSKTKKTG